MDINCGEVNWIVRARPIIRERLICTINQQNILRLQISVNEIEVVQEGNTCEKLACKCLDMSAREGCEVVGLQEIEDALAVQVRDDADVVTEVEAVAKMDALVAVVLVVLRKGGENSQFNPRGIAVLLH